MVRASKMMDESREYTKQTYHEVGREEAIREEKSEGGGCRKRCAGEAKMERNTEEIDQIQLTSLSSDIT